MMKLTVLVENTAPDGWRKEWGLSILAEYKEKQYLLDTGASALFAVNAENAGVDLSQVEFGVLSHAHFDHANGMRTFFEINQKAPFYIRKEAEENCYSTAAFFPAYVGIKKGTLKKYENRIQRVDGCLEAAEGLWLVPHKTPRLAEKGKRENMCIKIKHRLYWDNFSHEQSVVFETEQGLVIVNGCCHGGVDTIIKEVRRTFPGKPIYAVAGGFHLFKWSEDEVLGLCRNLKELEVGHIYTGHCTGKKAYAILERELGNKVEALETGRVFEL